MQLSPEEILLSVDVVRKRHPDKILEFSTVDFLEPTKEEMLQAIHRQVNKMKIRFSNRVSYIFSKSSQSLVISCCPTTNQTVIDKVSLGMSSEEFNGTVFDRIENCNESRTTVLQDVQCGVSPDEYAFVEKLCKSYEPLHAV